MLSHCSNVVGRLLQGCTSRGFLPSLPKALLSPCPSYAQNTLPPPQPPGGSGTPSLQGQPSGLSQSASSGGPSCCSGVFHLEGIPAHPTYHLSTLCLPTSHSAGEFPDLQAPGMQMTREGSELTRWGLGNVCMCILGGGMSFITYIPRPVLPDLKG